MKPLRIPVTVIGPGATMPLPGPGVVMLKLTAADGHVHEDDRYCPACAALGDVRAMLFDLLEAARQGLRSPFKSVLVDARTLPEIDKVIDALEGRLPARAMRDHTVARRFRLAGVVEGASVAV
jgi:hypothetical protein